MDGARHFEFGTEIDLGKYQHMHDRLNPNWVCLVSRDLYFFAIKVCIDSQGKNLLSSHISSTCAYNMANFGPLAAEID